MSDANCPLADRFQGNVVNKTELVQGLGAWGIPK